MILLYGEQKCMINMLCHLLYTTSFFNSQTNYDSLIIEFSNPQKKKKKKVLKY